MSNNDNNIKHEVNKRLKDIKAEIGAKKSITTTQAVKYLEHLADAVFTYDFSSEPYYVKMTDGTKAVNINHPSLQPQLSISKMANYDGHWKSLDSADGSGDKMASIQNGSTPMASTSRRTRSQSSNASEDSSDKTGVRYKGKIVGLESIRDEDEPSPKKSKTPTRSSRRQSSANEQKKSSKVVKEQSPEVFSSIGKRLGGSKDDKTNTSNLSAEERRQLLLRVTEQRVSQGTGRGRRSSAAESRSRRAPADLPEGIAAGPLHWNVN